MSVRVMSHVWEHSDARLGARLVLLAIADFANDTGMAWPSVETLAAKSRLSSRQVQRILRQLVDDGDLTLHENAGPHGCHLYQIVMAGDKSSGRQIVRGDKSGEQGVTNRRGGVTNPTKNVSKMSPEPSIEPPIEPSEEPSGMPRNGDAQTLLAVLYEDVLQIGPPTNYKLAVGQAQALVKAGSTPDEVRDIAEWLMADPFWSQKGITIGLVLKKRDEWRSAKSAPKPVTVPSFQTNGRKRDPNDVSASEWLDMVRKDAHR